MLDPGFFSDEDVARMSPLAQILFIGLLCYVDDHGNGWWLPKHIEGAIFPHVPVDILSLLGEVERAGFIARYQVRNTACFRVWNFDDYQKGLKYRRITSVPAPPENYDWEKDRPDTAITLVLDSFLKDSETL